MKNIILFLAVLLLVRPAFADDVQDIARAEAYFQHLTTATSRFIQTAPDGRQTQGNFYLSRPGRLRFEYDPPLKDFVVADGLFIYFYDAQLKQQSNAPVSQTLADFLLRKNLRLSGDLKVSNISHKDGLLQMTILQAAQPNAGSLTLEFTEKPELQIKKWQVRDATGALTRIELSNIQTGMELSPKLFVYFDPNKKGYN